MIVVGWKWVGEDARWGGVSDADRAALAVGLRLAGQTGDDVTVVTVGSDAAAHGLREALAAGAAAAVRLEAPAGVASAAVAAAIAGVADGATWVVCGDQSIDRGSGAVPAFVAAELGIAQALGLVDVAPSGRGVRATRRLDGGRREVLDVASPAVLSVEGSVARLRRASLPAELAAGHAAIPLLPGPSGPVDVPDAVAPYRPRARQLPGPSGDALARVRTLTDAGEHAAPAHTEILTLDPPTAAATILTTLRTWGYLPPEEN
jgi:electron transfer flavoprotein beta subunit